MKRVTVNAIVDIGCLLMFIPSLVSGLVLFLVLPSGLGKGNGLAVYLDIARSQWVNMHNLTSFAFAALLIIHLVLHWRFFGNIRKTFGANAKEPCETAE